MDNTMINELELMGHNAWVAEERLRLGGWILRADHGITRRANSVLPLAPQNIPLDFAIDSVLDFYNSRQLIPRFQVTKASFPSNLDKELEKRNFTIGLQVEIWTSSIKSLVKLETSCIAETSDLISEKSSID